MAVKSATVGRDRPRSTWDRKPTERSIFCASWARVSFLCLRRSWISAARVASSSWGVMKFMSNNFMKNYRNYFMQAIGNFATTSALGSSRFQVFR